MASDPIEYALKPEVKEDPKAVEKRDPIVESTPQPEKKIEEEKPDKPYSADYFEVSSWPDMLLDSKLDVDGIVDKIVSIDKFIKFQLLLDGRKDNSKSHNEILKKIEKSIGLKSTHKSHERVIRVFNFIDTVRRAREEADRKSAMLRSIIRS